MEVSIIEKLTNEKLFKDYSEIFDDCENMTNFSSYYKALVEILKKHPLEFTDEVREEWGLNELLSIDEDEYIVTNPDLSLDTEKERVGQSVYEDIDTMAMSIRDTLWDMVTVYSGRDCPINPNDELRFIKIVYKDDSNQILLECPGCGWTEDLEGKEYTGDFGKVFPVTEKEIQEYTQKY